MKFPIIDYQSFVPSRACHSFGHLISVIAVIRHESIELTLSTSDSVSQIHNVAFTTLLVSILIFISL
jgi:hypothetical protein